MLFFLGERGCTEYTYVGNNGMRQMEYFDVMVAMVTTSYGRSSEDVFGIDTPNAFVKHDD